MMYNAMSKNLLTYPHVVHRLIQISNYYEFIKQSIMSTMNPVRDICVRLYGVR